MAEICSLLNKKFRHFYIFAGKSIEQWSLTICIIHVEIVAAQTVKKMD
jgi:hypothetical protein